jgi:hypothetical protein
MYAYQFPGVLTLRESVMALVGRSADEAGRQGGREADQGGSAVYTQLVFDSLSVRTVGYEVILLSMRIATFEGEAPREGAQFLPKARAVVGQRHCAAVTARCWWSVWGSTLAMAGKCLNVGYRTLLAASHVARATGESRQAGVIAHSLNLAEC